MIYRAANYAMDTVTLLARTALFILFILPSVGYAQKIPLAYWKFDRSSGTTALDEQGNYDGTLNTGASFQPIGGYTDGAVDLNGTDGRVVLPNFDIAGSAISISAWINIRGTSTAERPGEGRIISKAIGTEQQEHYWMLGLNDGTRLRFRLRTDGSTKELESDLGAVPFTRWVHVGATYDGAKMRIFINGTQINSRSVSGTINMDNNAGVAIGNQPVGAGPRPFYGRLDEVRLYDQALSQAEMTALVGARAYAYYPLDEAANETTAVDRINGLDGTLQSGATFTPGGGYVEGGLTLDGTTGRVTLPSMDLAGNQLTISAWIYPTDITSSGANEGRIVSKATGTLRDDHYWMLGLDDGGRLRARIKTSDAPTTAELSSLRDEIQTNRWLFVALTYDGTTARLYLDGTEVAQQPLTGTIATSASTPVAIGNQPAGAGNRPFTGRLDEVRIYERGLTQAQLQDNMAAATALPVDWVSFTGTRRADGTVALRWQVADQFDNAGFYVEAYHTQSRRFQPLGFVPATPSDYYTFTARNLPASSHYRLRQLDLDGTEKLSPTITVTADLPILNLRAYPNPATNYLRTTTTGNYTILSATGQPLRRGVLTSPEARIPVHNLPRGATYYLRTDRGTVTFTR